MVAFAFLTPFFFIKGGLNLSLGAVWANLGVLALLAVAKILPKLGGVYPLARHTPPARGVHDAPDVNRSHLRDHHVAYGLRRASSTAPILAPVTVVVLSAVVPTAIAQRPLHSHQGRDRRRGGSGRARQPQPAARAGG